jgi:hypothetical protein
LICMPGNMYAFLSLQTAKNVKEGLPSAKTELDHRLLLPCLNNSPLYIYSAGHFHLDGGTLMLTIIKPSTNARVF